MRFGYTYSTEPASGHTKYFLSRYNELVSRYNEIKKLLHVKIFYLVITS